MKLSTETSVSQLEAAAVYQVRFPLAPVVKAADLNRMYLNAKRRTKTKQAAREIVSLKFLNQFEDWIDGTEVMQWVREQGDKVSYWRDKDDTNRLVVVCHDADAAILFKLKFC